MNSKKYRLHKMCDRYYVIFATLLHSGPESQVFKIEMYRNA